MYDRDIPSGGNSVVECLLAKEDVASSSLVSRSIKKRVSRLSFLLSIFVGNPWVINVLKLKHKTVKLNRKHVNLK